MTKKPTPAEQRADLHRQLAELELSRAKAAQDIVARMAEALASLKELHDPADGPAGPVPAGVNVNAEIGYVVTILSNVPGQLDKAVQGLEAYLTPPAPLAEGEGGPTPPEA